jgi:cytochrome c oxidase subunit 2
MVAILPGDLGFSQLFLGIIFSACVILVFIALATIFWSTRHPSDTGMKEARGWEKYEWIYTIAFLVVVMVFASSTLGLFQYPYAHSNIKPTMTVDVRAQQWEWCLSPAPLWGTDCSVPYKIPVGNIVLFNTSTIDVNHDFGLYDSSGALLDQVMIVPGYYDSIIYHFTKPGLYYVRCLEFCGWGHFGMTTEINVTAT